MTTTPDGVERKGETPLILVVDDYGDAREVYVRVCQAAGYRVAEAANGEEALEKGLSLRPDLVLMDLIIPGMDGWEVIRRLKADERTRERPIVVITGAHPGDGARRAHQEGCDAYLVKPVFPEALLRVVGDLLSPKAAG
jgi:two-component system, cell cycle response regulator DivK